MAWDDNPQQLQSGVTTTDRPPAAPSRRWSRQQFVDFWKSKGASDAAAQGIADDVVGVESGGSGTIINPASGATGAYQHLGDRLTRLQKLPNWQDPQVQSDFAYREVLGGDPQAAEGWEAIKNAKTKEEGKRLWDKYFERSGWATGALGSSNRPGGRFSPEGIAFEQGRSNTSVYYMDPLQFLAMLPPIEENAGERSKGRSLKKSLDSGDPIESLPVLEIGGTGDERKIIDYDGRHRAEAAVEAGLGLIPVAMHNLGEDQKPRTLQGLRGDPVPFDYAPVPKVPRETPGLISRVIESTFGRGAGGRFAEGMASVGKELQTLGAGAAVPELSIAEAAGGPSALGTLQQVEKERQDRLRHLEMTGETRWPYLAGEITATLPAAAIAPAEGAGLLARSGIGGLVGATMGAVEPAETIGQRAGNIGMGFLGGAIGVPVGEAVGAGVGAGWNALKTAVSGQPAGAVNEFIRDVAAQNALDNAARRAIAERTVQTAAGGRSPMETAVKLEQARGEGLPMTLADVDENVRALVGSVAREGGPARTRVAQWAAERLGTIERDSPLLENLEQGIDKYLATGSARTEAKALAEQRSAGRAAWEEAMVHGGIGSYRQQFENVFNNIARVEADATRDLAQAQREVTQTVARQTQTGVVDAKARQFAEDKVRQSENRLADVQKAKDGVRTIMERAQADGTANIPDAIWSPYIGRLLQNPEIKRGIARGYRIEQNIADGLNKPFRPRDYAVIGHEANGDPIVGTVPTMRLLATAKEGLDAAIEDARDPLTGRLTKEGYGLKRLRDGEPGTVGGGLVGELDRLNPRYKAARDQWAGDSALMGAVREGKEFHKRSPEEIREWFANASESEKNFYRIGAADTLRDDVSRAALAGDPSKRLINSKRAREQVRPMFRTEAEAEAFLSRMQNVREMVLAPGDVLRGSPTAAREAEDRARREGLDLAVDALHAIAGGPHGALRMGGAMARNLATGTLARRLRDPLNARIAQIALDPTLRFQNFSRGSNILNQLPLPRVQNALAQGAGRIGAPVGAVLLGGPSQ